MGLILSLLWENFCGIIVFQFVRHPPRRYGIRFYHNYAPPSCCGFFIVLDVGYFLVGSRILGNSCLAVSCDLGVLIRTSKLTYFTISISSSPGSSRKPELMFVLSVCFYLFIYVWLFWIFAALHRLSLVAASRCYCGPQCVSFSLRQRLLRMTGSRRAGFRSCSLQTQWLWLLGSRAWAQQLWYMGLVALQHVESSWARDQTRVPCIGRRVLTHCTNREVPELML